MRDYNLQCSRCGGTGQEPDWRQQGHAMRELRKNHGHSLRAMSNFLGISASYLSDMELGKRRYLPYWQEKMLKFL